MNEKWQKRAMSILTRKLQGQPLNDDEFIVLLGDIIHVEWEDESDPTKRTIVDFHYSDLHPFQVSKY